MKNVFVTRKIPDIGIKMLTEKGYSVDVSSKDRPLTKKELIKALKKKQYDAVLTLLTDVIDAEVMDAAPTVKIFANFAIGFNNIDIAEAKKRKIMVTNTPGGGADRVAEHTWALILALTCRLVEADSFVRAGKYKGWDPLLLLGEKVAGKTMGVIGAGKIGAEVLKKAVLGFEMKAVYWDVARNEKMEQELGVEFCAQPEDVLRRSDIVSLHVPLLDSTHHLINADRLKLMKKTAYLINTARGPVVDEAALVEALQTGMLRGAGIDVYEFEPKMTKGLTKLKNVVLSPHIASATMDAHLDMSRMAADNIIHILEGGIAVNPVYN